MQVLLGKYLFLPLGKEASEVRPSLYCTFWSFYVVLKERESMAGSGKESSASYISLKRSSQLSSGKEEWNDNNNNI